MPYYLISDFQAGLDTRKTPFSAPAGSLRRCRDAHINRGGEIEKRFGFTTRATLPPGTSGLHVLNDQLYVCGSGPEPLAIPASVIYQRLEPKSGNLGVELKRVLSTSSFNGKVYAIAEFNNGAIDHYYDGQRLTQWDAVAAEIAGEDAVARTLADRLRSDFGLLAIPKGNVVSVVGREVDKPFNLVSNTAGLFVTLEQTAGPTTPQISRIEFQAGFTLDLLYSVSVDGEEVAIEGRASGIGITAFTLQNRIFSTSQSLLRFSGFTDPGQSGNIPQPDPTRWDPSGGIGAGFINLSTQDAGSANLTAVAAYQGNLAVFSRQAVHIRSLAIDVANMRQIQLLQNLGTTAPRTVVSFGEADVFFLGFSGIRSLQARDSSNTAASADVGTPIDDELAEFLAESDPKNLRDAIGVIEPRYGRFLLFIGQRVYVFSQFPGSKINAWSTYEMPDKADAVSVSQDQVFVRIGDEILVYGGPSGRSFEGVQSDIVLPHMDFEDPGTIKNVTSMDLGCTGQWDVFVRPDPTLPEYEEYIGEVDGTTYGLGTTFPALASTTHLGFRFVSKSDGPAKIGQVIIHYQRGNQS